MSSRLDQIKARAEAATPGPWHAEQVGDFHADRERDWMIADVLRWCGNDAIMANALSFGVDGRTAQFVAHARDDVPWLLDCIENRSWATVYERTAWRHDIGEHAGSDHPYAYCPRCEMEHPLGRFAQVVKALEEVRHIASYGTNDDDERVSAIFKVAHDALTPPGGIHDDEKGAADG